MDFLEESKQDDMRGTQMFQDMTRMDSDLYQETVLSFNDCSMSMRNRNQDDLVRTVTLAESKAQNQAEMDRLSRTFEGEVEKQSPKMNLKIWQKRYFVLSHRILRYYKNQRECYENKPPKGIINFQQVLVNYKFQDDKKRIDLQIHGSTRVFELRCSGTHQYQRWVDNLKFSIDSSIGKRMQISLQSYKLTQAEEQSFKFWRFLRILEDVFLDQADTGDIILCSNKKKFSLQ